MERLLGMYRLTSSALAAMLLVAFNLVPLAGVLWWGWDMLTILALYWVENGIVGAYNVARMLRAEGSNLGGMARWRMNGRPIDNVARGALVGFFVMHYGIFWVVHGVFVLAFLPLMLGVGMFGSGPLDGGTPPFPFSGEMSGPHWALVGGGALGLAVSHGASFWLNYLRRGEYRSVSAAQLMLAPYGRLVILHLTIIFGAMASSMLGTPLGALVVLVTLKTLLDLYFHLREHRRIGREDAVPTTA